MDACDNENFKRKLSKREKKEKKKREKRERLKVNIIFLLDLLSQNKDLYKI